MSRKINWDRVRYLGKPTLSVKDEREIIKRSPATRWLERAGRCAARRKRTRAADRPRAQLTKAGRLRLFLDERGDARQPPSSHVRR